MPPMHPGRVVSARAEPTAAAGRAAARACAPVVSVSPSQAIPLRGPPAGAAGEIELKVDQAIALRKGGVDKGAANLLQGLDIDESLGLDQVDEQIRDYLSKKGVRVIELFRQWDDDGTGQIEKKEFRRGMKELGLTASKEQLDELFNMWDPDKTGGRSLPPRPRRDAPRSL